MTSRSAAVSAERPFYTRYADAYDALIIDPIEPWVEAVDVHLRRVGARGGTVLDAGCGTGRHARGLIDRGYRVELLDASSDLLGIASRRCPGAPTYTGDLCTLSLPRSFDAVICRGVLNDLVTDAERDGALSSFAGVLCNAGVVILDVRDSESSRAKSGIVQRKEVELLGGDRLVFTNTPVWSEGVIDVEEQYSLRRADGRQTTTHYSFRMRPWAAAELRSSLHRAGFDRVEIAQGQSSRAADRLFVVARRAVR